ncbi:DUF4873 domain-containing protein [Gordonia sp. CPCC 205515]|uniref:DUF4873 domain-containing protein n=1 Tax=Gordonia sp. CPCC 205515 TaxID=3140791 RepID=UPI003AF3A454
MIDGHGPLAERLRARIAKTPLPIPRVAVRIQPPPVPNYLGVASADHRGELFLDDPRALDHVMAVLEHLATSGASSMVVRRSVQSQWMTIASSRKLRKRLRRFEPDDYDWIGTESIDDDVFDGPLVLSTDDTETVARARIAGYLDPLDGQYHWSGTIFGTEVRSWKEARVTAVSVAVAGESAVDARLTEITPSGDVRVVGVGTPPYVLESLVV